MQHEVDNLLCICQTNYELHGTLSTWEANGSSASQLHFIEPKSSLRCWQEQIKSSQCPPIQFLSLLCLVIPSGIFRFLHQTMHIFLFSPIPATWSAHFILPDLMTLILARCRCNLWSFSPRNLLHSPVTWFSKTSRPTLRPTQPSIQLLSGSVPWSKAAGVWGLLLISI